MKNLFFFGFLFGVIQLFVQQGNVFSQKAIVISPSDSIRWANTPQLKFEKKMPQRLYCQSG